RDRDGAAGGTGGAVGGDTVWGAAEAGAGAGGGDLAVGRGSGRDRGAAVGARGGGADGVHHEQPGYGDHDGGGVHDRLPRRGGAQPTGDEVVYHLAGGADAAGVRDGSAAGAAEGARPRP